MYESTVTNCVDELASDDDLTFSANSWPKSVHNVAVPLVARFVVTEGCETAVWTVSEFEAGTRGWADEIDNNLHFIINFSVYSVALILIWELFVEDGELVSRAATTIVFVGGERRRAAKVVCADRFPQFLASGRRIEHEIKLDLWVPETVSGEW